jgi:Tfp pilus assembly PilM family ATPase
MMKVIPYPFDGAAYDYDRVPGNDGYAGVLWVSAASQQVEWVREAVSLAGKVPAVVDAQACALANTFTFNYQPPADQTAVLLEAGPRRMSMALMRGSLLLSSRDATLVREGSSEPTALPALVVRELDRRWDALVQRAAPAKPQKIFVSGGAATLKALRDALGEHTGLEVEEINPFKRILYAPGTEPGRIAKEHGATLAVAVGLALRGIEEL